MNRTSLLRGCPAPCPLSRLRHLAALALCVSACAQMPAGDDLGGQGADAAQATKGVVINEVFPHGDDALTDPDWAELKNVGDAEVDLSGYKVRDDKAAAALPAGTRLAPGAYLVLYCDDVPDGGAAERIHLPFKLGGGDELHLLKADGAAADSVVWAAGVVPNDRSWGRLPDGSGQFAATKPTPAARNQ